MRNHVSAKLIVVIASAWLWVTQPLRADVTGANFAKADINGANFRGVVGRAQAKGLDQARNRDKAIFDAQ